MTRISGIGAAVVGTGFIGTVHVEALRRIGVHMLGVLGSTPDRGAARAEALGVQPVRLARRPPRRSEVTVVHVTSPNACMPQAQATSRPASTSSARSRSR